MDEAPEKCRFSGPFEGNHPRVPFGPNEANI
jgi:hypothetical protein